MIKKAVVVCLLISFTTQIGFGSLAQASLWEERGARQKQHTETPLLAALPVVRAVLPSFPNQDPLKEMGVSVPSFSNSAAGESSLRRRFPHRSGHLTQLLKSIPAHSARVVSVHDEGRAAPTVVLIQDIHMNAEAQTNIGSLLQELISENTISKIGLEGAFEPLDFSIFRAFPDRSIVQHVAGAYLKRDLLAAPSYVGLTHPASLPPMVGVDDRFHYDANVNAYLASRSIRAARERDTAKLDMDLTELKSQSFTGDLKLFDQHKTRYEKGQLTLGAYIKALMQMGERTDKSPTLVIERFLSAFDMESRLDFSKVEAERTLALETLSRALNEKELAELLQISLDHRLGRRGFGDYHHTLRALLEEKGVPLRRLPHFSAYIQYCLLTDGIKEEELTAALSNIEEELESKLLQTPFQNNLYQLGRLVEGHRKMIRFELTPREWTHIQKRNAALRQGDFERDARLAPYAQRLKGVDLSSFESFYREADIRSHLLLENLMKEPASHPRVVVVGGFHTPLMVEELIKRKASVLVVSPRLTKVDDRGGSSYLSAFDREKSSLDRLFAGRKLFLATGNNIDHPGLQARLYGSIFSRTFQGQTPIVPVRGDEPKNLSVVWNEDPSLDQIQAVPIPVKGAIASPMNWSELWSLLGEAFSGEQLKAAWDRAVSFVSRHPWWVAFGVAGLCAAITYVVVAGVGGGVLAMTASLPFVPLFRSMSSDPLSSDQEVILKEVLEKLFNDRSKTQLLANDSEIYSSLDPEQKLKGSWIYVMEGLLNQFMIDSTLKDAAVQDLFAYIDPGMNSIYLDKSYLFIIFNKWNPEDRSRWINKLASYLQEKSAVRSAPAAPSKPAKKPPAPKKDTEAAREEPIDLEIQKLLVKFGGGRARSQAIKGWLANYKKKNLTLDHVDFILTQANLIKESAKVGPDNRNKIINPQLISSFIKMKKDRAVFSELVQIVIDTTDWANSKDAFGGSKRVEIAAKTWIRFNGDRAAIRKRLNQKKGPPVDIALESQVFIDRYLDLIESPEYFKKNFKKLIQDETITFEEAKLLLEKAENLRQLLSGKFNEKLNFRFSLFVETFAALKRDVNKLDQLIGVMGEVELQIPSTNRYYRMIILHRAASYFEMELNVSDIKEILLQQQIENPIYKQMVDENSTVVGRQINLPLWQKRFGLSLEQLDFVLKLSHDYTARLNQSRAKPFRPVMVRIFELYVEEGKDDEKFKQVFDLAHLIPFSEAGADPLNQLLNAAHDALTQSDWNFQNAKTFLESNVKVPPHAPDQVKDVTTNPKGPGALGIRDEKLPRAKKTKEEILAQFDAKTQKVVKKLHLKHLEVYKLWRTPLVWMNRYPELTLDRLPQVIQLIKLFMSEMRKPSLFPNFSPQRIPIIEAVKALNWDFQAAEALIRFVGSRSKSEDFKFKSHFPVYWLEEGSKLWRQFENDPLRLAEEISKRVIEVAREKKGIIKESPTTDVLSVTASHEVPTFKRHFKPGQPSTGKPKGNRIDDNLLRSMVEAYSSMGVTREGIVAMLNTTRTPQPIMDQILSMLKELYSEGVGVDLDAAYDHLSAASRNVLNREHFNALFDLVLKITQEFPSTISPEKLILRASSLWKDGKSLEDIAADIKVTIEKTLTKVVKTFRPVSLPSSPVDAAIVRDYPVVVKLPGVVQRWRTRFQLSDEEILKAIPLIDYLLKCVPTASSFKLMVTDILELFVRLDKNAQVLESLLNAVIETMADYSKGKMSVSMRIQVISLAYFARNRDMRAAEEILKNAIRRYVEKKGADFYVSAAVTPRADPAPLSKEDDEYLDLLILEFARLQPNKASVLKWVDQYQLTFEELEPLLSRYARGEEWGETRSLELGFPQLLQFYINHKRDFELLDQFLENLRSSPASTQINPEESPDIDQFDRLAAKYPSLGVKASRLRQLNGEYKIAPDALDLLLRATRLHIYKTKNKKGLEISFDEMVNLYLHTKSSFNNLDHLLSYVPNLPNYFRINGSQTLAESLIAIWKKHDGNRTLVKAEIEARKLAMEISAGSFTNGQRNNTGGARGAWGIWSLFGLTNGKTIAWIETAIVSVLAWGVLDTLTVTSMGPYASIIQGSVWTLGALVLFLATTHLLLGVMTKRGDVIHVWTHSWPEAIASTLEGVFKASTSLVAVPFIAVAVMSPSWLTLFGVAVSIGVGGYLHARLNSFSDEEFVREIDGLDLATLSQDELRSRLIQVTTNTRLPLGVTQRGLRTGQPEIQVGRLADNVLGLIRRLEARSVLTPEQGRQFMVRFGKILGVFLTGERNLFAGSLSTLADEIDTVRAHTIIAPLIKSTDPEEAVEESWRLLHHFNGRNQLADPLTTLIAPTPNVQKALASYWNQRMPGRVLVFVRNAQESYLDLLGQSEGRLTAETVLSSRVQFLVPEGVEVSSEFLRGLPEGIRHLYLVLLDQSVPVVVEFTERHLENFKAFLNLIHSQA